jgi:hypothetical protein
MWPNLPPVEHRIRLLHDFRAAHKETIANSVNAAVRCEDVSRFDYASRYLEINLRYRMDSNDNPGIAFHIKEAKFHLFTELEIYQFPCGINTASLKSQHESYKTLDRQARATNEDFAGLLRVLWMMEGYTFWDWYIVHSHAYNEVDREWLFHLRRMVEGGFVVRGVGNFGRVGRIDKDGGKWRWKELPGAAGDLKTYGYSFMSQGR